LAREGRAEEAPTRRYADRRDANPGEQQPGGIIPSFSRHFSKKAA
jgi:hypothetical protein